VVRSVAFSPDGKRLLSGSADKTLRLWDATTGELLQTLAGHADQVLSVAFSPDGEHVLSGSRDRTLKLWDASSGRLLRTFEGHADQVSAVAFSPDGTHVLSGSGDSFLGKDNTVGLWDAESGELLFSLVGHRGQVTSVAFSPDGRQGVSSSWDNTLRVWDLDAGQLRHTLVGHAASAVVFLSSGAEVLSAGYNGAFRVWDVATGMVNRAWQGHSGAVTALALAPDGERFISGSNDATAKLWRLRDERPLTTLLASPAGDWLAITPAGFFNASEDGHELVSVVRGIRTYALQQVRSQLDRKDLVAERLAGDPARRYANEMAKVSLEDILTSGEPPAIKLVRKEVIGESVRLTVMLSNRENGGIGRRLEWRVNGRLQGSVEAKASASGLGSLFASETLQLERERINVITVSGFNGRNQLSTRPLRIEVATGGLNAHDKRRLRP
jgi:WD40 repeat protein